MNSRKHSSKGSCINHVDNWGGKGVRLITILVDTWALFDHEGGGGKNSLKFDHVVYTRPILFLLQNIQTVTTPESTRISNYSPKKYFKNDPWRTFQRKWCASRGFGFYELQLFAYSKFLLITPLFWSVFKPRKNNRCLFYGQNSKVLRREFFYYAFSIIICRV